MGGVCRPLLTLIWKDWRFHRRHYILTFFEFILPLCIPAWLTYDSSTLRAFNLFKYNGSINSENILHKHEIFYEPYDLNPYNWPYDLYYAPNTSSCTKFVKDAFSNPYSMFKGFETEDDLEKYLRYKNELHMFRIQAVIFSECDPNSKVLKYKVRSCCTNFRTNMLYGSLSDVRSEEPSNFPKFFYSTYLQSSFFIQIQRSIDLMFIKLHANTIQKKQIIENLRFTLQSMPYPPNDEVKAMSVELIAVSFVMIINFVFIFPIIVKRIVEEKCSRTKEIMKMMGISELTYWTGTFISNFLELLLHDLFIVFMFSIEFVKGHSVVLRGVSPSLFFVLMLLYSISSLLFCFLITTVFNKPSYAVIMTVIIWIGSFLGPFILVVPFGTDVFANTHFNTKVLTCLLPNMAFVWVWFAFSHFEFLKGGTHWKEVLESPTIYGDGFNIGLIFGMFLVSSLIYIVLIWYLDSVWPWKPGVPKPFYFCFL
ncbi:ATP-binding cassette sub-family A member 3-like, partial [Centruroides sculpturatus]|uniref:ATP-binding cassette sub-family A member 3-like n=1 Tax=Centruroides sculpturatus TaxID=218467 RepID=UPI000C6CF131